MKAASVLFTFLFSLTASAQDVEDWDFTRADYQALLSRGGQLRFKADSDWLTPEFQKNLKVTIEHVLNPQAALPSAYSVSLTDFYHGHLGCVTPSRVRGWAFYEETVYQKLCEDMKVDCKAITQENLSDVIRVLKAMEEVNHRILVRALNSPLDCTPVVMYHTFEASDPTEGKLDNRDPRRNILTLQSNLKPTNYLPPPANYQFELEDDPKVHPFYHLLTFAFLVDKDGVIHVTRGSTPQLSKVVGKVIKGFSIPQ